MGLWHRGVVWRVIDGLGFHTTVSLQIFLAEKYPYEKELCVLKAVVWNLHVQKPLAGFATSRRGRSGGPVSDQSRARTVVSTDPLHIILIYLKILILASRWLKPVPCL